MRVVTRARARPTRRTTLHFLPLPYVPPLRLGKACTCADRFLPAVEPTSIASIEPSPQCPCGTRVNAVGVGMVRSVLVAAAGSKVSTDGSAAWVGVPTAQRLGVGVYRWRGGLAWVYSTAAWRGCVDGAAAGRGRVSMARRLGVGVVSMARRLGVGLQHSGLAWVYRRHSTRPPSFKLVTTTAHAPTAHPGSRGNSKVSSTSRPCMSALPSWAALRRRDGGGGVVVLCAGGWLKRTTPTHEYS